MLLKFNASTLVMWSNSPSDCFAARLGAVFYDPSADCRGRTQDKRAADLLREFHHPHLLHVIEVPIGDSFTSPDSICTRVRARVCCSISCHRVDLAPVHPDPTGGQYPLHSAATDPQVPDRVLFDKLVAVLVLGAAYAKIAPMPSAQPPTCADAAMNG